MPNVIDDLRIKIQGEAASANSAIDSAVAQLERLRNACTGIGAGHIITQATVNKMNAFADAVNRIDTQRLSDVIAQLGQLSTAIQGLGTINRLGTLVTQRQADDLYSFGLAVRLLDMDRLRELASLDFTRLNLGGLSNVNSLNVQLQHLSGNIDKLQQSIANMGNRSSQSSRRVKDLTRSVRSLRSASHSTHNPLAKLAQGINKLVHSIGRIAFYRAVRGVIKSITKGLEEGTKELYHWAELSGNIVAPSLDRIASAADYVKRGFAAMWSPLINAAAPVIEAIAKKVVDFFNMVQKGFAYLTGADHWTKALWVPTKFDEETDKANKKAKELKNTLQEFDELNVINTPTSGSGSSGKEEKDYSGMFETVYEKLEKFDWGNLGEKIADALGNFGDAVNNFLDKTDWVQLGIKISEFTSKLARRLATRIRNQNWGEAAAKFGKAIADIITGANKDNQVAEALKELFSSIFDQLPGLALGIGEGAGAILSSVARALGMDDVADWIDENITKPIADARKDLDENGGGKGFWKRYFEEDLPELANYLSVGYAKQHHPNARSEGVIEKPSDQHSTKKQIDSTYEWFSETIEKAKTKWENFTIWLTKPFYDAANRLMDKWERFKLWWDKLEYKVSFIVDNIKGKVEEKWNAFKEWWADKKAQVKMIFPNIKAKISEKWYEFLRWWTERKATLKMLFPNIKAEIIKKWNLFTKWWAEKKAELKMVFPNIVEKVKKKWDEFTNWWKDKVVDLKIQFPDLLAGMQQKWNELLNWWNSLTLPTLGGGISLSAAGKGEKGYAAGGFPQRGELFLANEAGPELVGSIGGRTAVVSNNEISGIADAVREQGNLERVVLNEMLMAIRSQRLTISPSAQLGQVVARSSRLWSGVTG